MGTGPFVLILSLVLKLDFTLVQVLSSLNFTIRCSGTTVGIDNVKDP